MKKIIFGCVVLLYSLATIAQEMIPLWPEGRMPNSKGLALKDSISEERLYQVGSPRIYAYLAPENKNTGVAVLVVPGGGYIRLPESYDNNPFARYFNSIGINAFVLCHRLPTSPDLVTRQTGPLQDAQRAMKIIRSNADKWKIDINKIGVNGASAGGHVASTLATYAEDVSNIGDAVDVNSCHPDFMILISPVISMKDGLAHQTSRRCLLGENPDTALINTFSNETQVNEKTPPAFLVHADNDKSVSPLNSIAFYQALKAAGVSSSLHIFLLGGHGITIKGNPGSTEMWPDICTEWLKEINILE